MAFTGVATVKQVSDRMFRVTGVSLAFGASGTISFSEGAGDVVFEAPAWQPYESVALEDAIEVSVNTSTDVGAAVPIVVEKAGTTHADFLITLTNALDEITNSGSLEIYLELH